MNETADQTEKPKKKFPPPAGRAGKTGNLVDGLGRKIKQGEKKESANSSDISMDIADKLLKKEENLAKKVVGNTLQTFSMILPKNEDGEFTKAVKEFARDGSAIAATTVATGGATLPVVLGAIALKRLIKLGIKVYKNSNERDKNQVGEVSQENMDKYGVNVQKQEITTSDMQAFEEYAVKYGVKYDLETIDAPDSCTVKMDIKDYENIKTALENNSETPKSLLEYMNNPIKKTENGTCEVEMIRKDLKFFDKQLTATYKAEKQPKIGVRKTPAVWQVRFQAKDAETLTKALQEFSQAMEKQKDSQAKNPLNIKQVLKLFEFTTKHTPKKAKNKDRDSR